MAPSFYVYILRCVDDSLYVGHTDDMEKRMSEHELGIHGGYTKSRRPVRLVYSEEFSSRDEAFRRERQLKSWTRAKKEALIRARFDSLVPLSVERTGLRRVQFGDWATDSGPGAALVHRQAQDERS